MNQLQPEKDRRSAGELSRTQFLLMIGLFWLYVTVSNVLYAYGMRTGVAKMTDAPLWAPADARVLQHLLLLPVLVISYRVSLRIRWRPILAAVPLQVALAVFFAALAYPAMIVAEATVTGTQLHAAIQEHAQDGDLVWTSLWLASFVNFLPTYGFGLALVTGSELYAQFRNSELKRSALEREWSAARLSALRMQLSPHTLFNLLHTIRGHIDWDPKGAQTMVVQLADLLRRLLNAGEQEFSRLSDELKFVRLYLALQQRRFADRLSIVLPPADNLPQVWVPSLILQPLVENAVVHGLAHHQGPVEVRVGVEQAGDSLILRVTNTIAPGGPYATGAAQAAMHGASLGASQGAGSPVGGPLALEAAGGEAIGLKNVRERLAVQFGGRASLAAGAQGSEWVSEITLPVVRE